MDPSTYEIKRAYQTLGMLTPLKADCGKLCNAKCCQGNDSQGMYVFPGEMELLAKEPSYRFSGESFVVCQGACHRHRRPLSCRIFPFLPVYKNEKLLLVIDPRARFLCPIASREASEFWDQEFLIALYRIFHRFLNVPELKNSILKLTDTYDSYLKFFKK